MGGMVEHLLAPGRGAKRRAFQDARAHGLFLKVARAEKTGAPCKFPRSAAPCKLREIERRRGQPNFAHCVYDTDALVVSRFRHRSVRGRIRTRPAHFTSVRRRII